MLRYAFISLLLIQSTLVLAQDSITPPDSPIIVYTSDNDFIDTKENLEMAINDRGMSVTNVLHISTMLDRTAKDTGSGEKLYEEAESLEFCSVLMSYRMSKAHPANLSICPLTVSLYSEAGAADKVYVAYRRPVMMGDAEAVTADLIKLLDGIAQEAIE